MIALSPALLIAAANTYIGRGNEPGEDNGERTREADRVGLFLRNVHPLSDNRSSVAFLDHVGYWSHYQSVGRYSAWPLPIGSTCDDLAAFARVAGITTKQSPLPGDLFLAWSPLHKGFSLVGIVVGLGQEPWCTDGHWWYDCHTLEGLAGVEGEAPWWSYRARRRLCTEVGDLFIRWADMDPRLTDTSPAPRGPKMDGPRVRRAA